VHSADQATNTTPMFQQHRKSFSYLQNPRFSSKHVVMSQEEEFKHPSNQAPLEQITESLSSYLPSQSPVTEQNSTPQRKLKIEKPKHDTPIEQRVTWLALSCVALSANITILTASVVRHQGQLNLVGGAVLLTIQIVLITAIRCFKNSQRQSGVEIIRI